MAVLLIAVFAVPSGALARVNFGQKVIIDDGITTNDAVSFGHDVIVYGMVTSDAVSFGGDVTVEPGGQIKGDAVSIGGDIFIKEGGVIHGDAVSLGGEVNVSPGGILLGEKVSKDRLAGTRILKNIIPYSLAGLGSLIAKNIFLGPFIGIFGSAGFLIGIVFLLIKLVISFAIAALINYFFPGKVLRMGDYVQEDFPKALFFGIAILILVPFILLFLIISLIGIPLVPLVLVILFFVYLLGSVGIALWVGRIIPESENRSQLINVLLGVLVIGIAKHIPVAGIFITIAVLASSFGALLLSHSSVKSQEGTS